MGLSGVQAPLPTKRRIAAVALSLVLRAISPAIAQAPTAPPPPALASTPNPAPSAIEGTDTLPNTGLFPRIGLAFADQWSLPAYTAPAPAPVPTPQPAAASAAPTTDPTARRGFPSPFDSPPYPDAEWQLGGTPLIGDTNDLSAWPLMQGLYAGPNGQAWKDSRVQIYGWVDVGGNLSTSHTTNAPASYDVRPNNVDLDQAVVYIERQPNEQQTDHLDWGFRASALYGLDYRYTTMDGIFSNQLLEQNKWYGWDMPMIYADLYVPGVAEGLNIRAGRYISLPDIEAQLAPDNLLYSHSILYTVDPYTQIGVMASIKLSSQWLIQAGISGGNDVAIWVHGPTGARPTLTTMVQWISADQKDSLYFGINSLNNGHYGYNNVQMFVNTWSHKFNDTVWTSTEMYYMYQKDVPASALPANVTAGYAPEWGIVNYTMFRLSGSTYFSVRNEYYDDEKGQRTGYATPYSEHSVGIAYWPNKIVTIRPELRYEHSYTQPAYDNGLKHNQAMLAGDVIFHF